MNKTELKIHCLTQWYGEIKSKINNRKMIYNGTDKSKKQKRNN